MSGHWTRWPEKSAGHLNDFRASWFMTAMDSNHSVGKKVQLGKRKKKGKRKFGTGGKDGIFNRPNKTKRSWVTNGKSLGRFKPQKHEWDPTSAQFIRSSYQEKKLKDSSWAVFSSHKARLYEARQSGIPHSGSASLISRELLRVIFGLC